MFGKGKEAARIVYVGKFVRNQFSSAIHIAKDYEI